MAEDERCGGCDRSLGWIDTALVCPNGCLYCIECGHDAGSACSACGEHLRHRASRARPLPGR